ncbi:MAG: hypothetical protein PVSMB2_36150 [Ktedonobacteraceae bacterium]
MNIQETFGRTSINGELPKEQAFTIGEYNVTIVTYTTRSLVPSVPGVPMAGLVVTGATSGYFQRRGCVGNSLKGNSLNGTIQPININHVDGYPDEYEPTLDGAVVSFRYRPSQDRPSQGWKLNHV